MNPDHKTWVETEEAIVKSWSENLDIQKGCPSSNWFRAIEIPKPSRRVIGAADIIKEKLGLDRNDIIMLFKEDYTQCKLFERNAIANWNHFPWNPIWQRKWKIPEILQSFPKTFISEEDNKFSTRIVKNNFYLNSVEYYIKGIKPERDDNSIIFRYTGLNKEYLFKRPMIPEIHDRYFDWEHIEEDQWMTYCD